MAKVDIYGIITDRIIEQLEKGVIPWEKPWTGTQSGAISGATGKAYSLLNQMLLGRPGEYYTYNQVLAKGGHVRKGEKAQLVVFWKQVKTTEQDEAGQTIEKIIPMLKYYSVFHCDQCEGIAARQRPAIEIAHPAADNIIAEYSKRERLAIQHQRGDDAYYSPSRDCVVLPLREQFNSVSEYFSTAFHELTHSTGHSSRLDRLKATAYFGNTEYSKEELIAEIGAAALLNYTGLETRKSLRNNAAYVQSWLNALRNDKRMIVQASGAASKAVDYIIGESKEMEICC